MCNQAVDRRRLDSPSDRSSGEMEASASSPPAAAADEPPRVKFLCSFGGSILPRPLDGRLRYVGGETRIISVPRDVSYVELMGRMRELFEGVSAIKYQQPDEDLDALVSVVNDDDVMNMMEEYDKLGASGDGYTRLRIFLFSQQNSDIDAAGVVGSPYDSDEREKERRYVDALNSLNDSKPTALPEVAEQLFGPGGIDAALHSHLQHLNINIPRHGQRYGDIDDSWSPAYYSPGTHTPSSPSSARYHGALGEIGDRIAEEYTRYSPGYTVHQYEQQSPPYVENVVWLPPGAVVQEKAGFPRNLGNSQYAMEGSSFCDHYRMVYPRGPPTTSDPRFFDPRLKHGQLQMEQPAAGTEYAAQFHDSCDECYRKKEGCMLGQDLKLDPGVYAREQNEQRQFYNESHIHDRGWAVHHHQLNDRLDDPRVHLSGGGRVGERYIIDNSGMNHQGSFLMGSSNCINHDDARHSRIGTELGNEVFHDNQTVGGPPHSSHIPVHEDAGIQYGNYPCAYGADNLYLGQHSLPPIQSTRRQLQVTIRPGYESPVFMVSNGASPRFSRVGMEDQFQNLWTASNGGASRRVLGFDGSSTVPEYYHDHGQGSSNIPFQDGQLSYTPDVQCQPSIFHAEVPVVAAPLVPTPLCSVDDKIISASCHIHPKIDADVNLASRATEAKNLLDDGCGIKCLDVGKEADGYSSTCPKNSPVTALGSSGTKSTKDQSHITKHGESDANVVGEHGKISVESLGFLPELIDSVKKAVLEGAEEVKARAQADSVPTPAPCPEKKNSSLHEPDPQVPSELDMDSDDEDPKVCKIEPSTAEAEALAKGLQTIKNDDLEEIRQLGSGTYGAVYHGKWKGSDVAIKRIKASCFAGKPSERERLIADFWREALILSSLHHPNVVSFYGVVRDGPDSSLATVTEFMVNGSLKQFLQKKDRTIDRRKRLIIAMDAAFGMEYLHGKNIVHFDLKCENLLVNMRDPHRPICKIGDLGLSKVKQHTLVSGGVRGTLPWMAPELLSGKSSMVSEKIDVYSFGMVMWELLTGEEPYSDVNCASIIGGIVNNTLRPQIPTWCDPEWRSLMESCWSAEPTLRPSFSEISQRLRKMAAAINLK